MPDIRRWATTALALTALGGCARPGVIFDPANRAMGWPPPPDAPHVQYLGQIRTSEDLKPGRGLGGALARIFVGKEQEPPTLLSPKGVCTDLHERVFVADDSLKGVHVFDLHTREYAMWRPPEKSAEPFVQPVACAWDPAGRLLVSDSASGLIHAFGTRGEYLGALGNGVLRRPVGLAVQRGSGRLYVADASLHQVVVLDSRGKDVGRIGERGSSPGQFNFPTHVALSEAGELCVSDSLNFRVQVFGPEGMLRRVIGKKGDMPGTFSQPKGIALDPEGHIFVVDSNFEAVQVFNRDGELLMTFGREGTGPGEFYLPVGIWIDPMGRVFVADWENRRIQVFQYLSEEQPQ